MTTSKIANTDDVSAYERWELPLVNGTKVSSAAELESIQEAAYKEGYASGQNKGYEEKKHELEKITASFRSIIAALAEPLKELDDSVVNQLAQLSMMVAKQVVRRELHTEEGEIVGIVREAMSALPANTHKIILNIHPDDGDLIRTAFSLGDETEADELRWKVVEDPLITRGGCKISSENSR
ncbi:MAG: flagellar assembly protein FliH, partial [Gammaproteobacteria bacterium]|nr:flagellar assembly protein FliH [Gammaproteobacteria bacterium]